MCEAGRGGGFPGHAWLQGKELRSRTCLLGGGGAGLAPRLGWEMQQQTFHSFKPQAGPSSSTPQRLLSALQGFFAVL